MKSKEQEEIIDKVFKYWISLFRCPQRFLSNNEEKFNNFFFRNMSDILNTHVITVAAADKSFWLNEITEKCKSIICNMMGEIKKEVHCSIEVVLTWAVSV